MAERGSSPDDPEASVSTSAAGRALSDLLGLMARLRSPVDGCPWDTAQTFQTIAPYTIEEAYEVAEAIRLDDPAMLRDELGDLLFQVVFHARMAQERGWFDFADVARGITDKMVRRHPHVFGDTATTDALAVPGSWEGTKAAERAASGQTRVLDGVALALPALMRAQKLQRRAARVGFDWASLPPILAKIEEELAELRAELDARAHGASVGTRITDEMGDVLFAVVNLARHLDIDAEAALRSTNEKFMRRFGHVEARLAADGVAMDDASLDTMEALWVEAKRLGL